MNIKELENKYEIDITCCSKDRHSEVGLLLQSLRNQSFKKWNIILLDDASGIPISQCGFFNSLINRVRLEGHKVKLLRNNISYGVCYARNMLINEQLKWDTGSNVVARLDDDVILNPDYLERMLLVLEEGYDMASGIIPLLAQPEMVREIKYVGDIICRHELDNEGNIIVRNDDLGFAYLQEGIKKCDQFRTNCLYKVVVHKDIRYPTVLTCSGFREELWFSFQAILKGFKIGVDTGAVALHFSTPSGGVRCSNYSGNVMLDEQTTNKWVKELFYKHGDFLKRYHGKFN